MRRFRKGPATLERRRRWNEAMVDQRRELGLPTVNLDWDTAMFLFDQGVAPEEAARRISQKD